jgi:hypothetical protein
VRDICRLAADKDRWWKNIKQDAIVLSGRRLEDVISLRGPYMVRIGSTNKKDAAYVTPLII